MAIQEYNDLVYVTDSEGDLDWAIDSNGDFKIADFLDTSLLRSIHGEQRALPNEMIIPETRRGWIGNEFQETEDGSKVWLFEQSPLNRKTLNGVKSALENSLDWMLDVDAAISFSVAVNIEEDINGQLFLQADMSIQRSTSRTDNRFFTLFENSGVTL